MTRPIEELYSQSVASGTEQEQVQYFTKKLVAHPHLKSAKGLAIDNIEFAPHGEIVAIIGPEMAGTSRLAASLKKYYASNWTATGEVPANDSMLHSISIDAPGSTGRVDLNYWKRVLLGMLAAGGDILCDRKIFIPASEFQLCHSLPSVPHAPKNNDVLLAATLRMLLQRQTNVLFINQAERLFPKGDPAGCRLTQQMLRDLASESQTRIVLVSNYQILFATEVRGDFLQGKQLVHLRRYDHTDESEYAEFSSTLAELLGHVAGPYRLKQLTDKGAKRLYLNSTGCIPVVKNTLLLTVGHAHGKRERITEDMLLECGNTNAVAAKRAEDALRGERMLTDVTENEVERILNGHKVASRADFADRGQQSTAASSGKAVPKAAPAYRKLGIGERKPTRDPVGGVYAKRA